MRGLSAVRLESAQLAGFTRLALACCMFRIFRAWFGAGCKPERVVRICCCWSVTWSGCMGEVGASTPKPWIGNILLEYMIGMIATSALAFAKEAMSRDGSLPRN